MAARRTARTTPTTLKETPVADQPGTELAVREQYPIVALAESGDLAEILEMNVGGTLTAFDFDRVRIPAGGGRRWTIPTLDGDEDTPTVEGVIVHWKDTRAYWRDSYTGAKNPPDCSSRDNQVGEGIYGRGSEGNPSGLCADCPMSKFGTGTNDKGEPTNAQACKQVRLLFLVRPGENLPIVVGLPPTSLRPMHRFFLRLAGKAVPYDGIITRLNLEQEKSSGGIVYSRVAPTVGKILSPEEQAGIRKYGEGIRQAVDSMVIDHGEFVNPDGSPASVPTASQAAQTGPSAGQA